MNAPPGYPFEFTSEQLSSIVGAMVPLEPWPVTFDVHAAVVDINRALTRYLVAMAKPAVGLVRLYDPMGGPGFADVEPDAGAYRQLADAANDVDCAFEPDFLIHLDQSKSDEYPKIGLEFGTAYGARNGATRKTINLSAVGDSFVGEWDSADAPRSHDGKTTVQWVAYSGGAPKISAQGVFTLAANEGTFVVG